MLVFSYSVFIVCVQNKITFQNKLKLKHTYKPKQAGTAAYKTVELDDLLGDEPVQYREVQGCETKKFLDLFPKVTILEGGVDSGFRAVKAKEYKPRLLHVTGYKKHVQVYQVPLKATSLNNSDSFVLDAGLKIFQFNGTKSSAWEKRKANAIVDELQASRHGKVKETYIIDGIEGTISVSLLNSFSFFCLFYIFCIL